MGGYGSGNWQDDVKGRVETSLTLEIEQLVQKGILSEGVRKYGVLRWPSNDFIARYGPAIDCEINTWFKPAAWVRFYYHPTNATQELSYYVHLTTTQPNYGGTRWWFNCPIIKKGVPCSRRVGRLHRPADAKYFGCRICHNLTYLSCQMNHRFKRMLPNLSENYFGATPMEVKRSFEENCKFRRTLHSWRWTEIWSISRDPSVLDRCEWKYHYSTGTGNLSELLSKIIQQNVKSS